MARYIDADKLMQDVQSMKFKKFDERNELVAMAERVFRSMTEQVLCIIYNAPTADVVPRVCNWEALAKAYAKLLDETCEKYEAELAKAKSEVAREIFEEIENFLKKTIRIIENSLDEAVRNDKFDAAKLFSNEAELIRTIIICLAELKKKYTEGER